MKMIILIMALMAISITTLQGSFNSPTAEGEILIDQNTGKLLYGKNVDKQMYPASTTKVMTALLVMENGSLMDKVKVGEEIKLIASDSSTAGLYIGQELSVRELMESLMLASGNDSANTLAVYIGRRTSKDPNMSHEAAIQAFVGLMNKRAKELGAINTSFTNPHGYHDENHYSTPYDLAIITLEAMRYRDFEDMVGKPQAGKWKNRNLLVIKENPHYYPPATGLKTGYTPEAGYCLIASASDNGVDLISIVLNSTKEGRWVVSKELLEKGFNKLH